MRLPARISSAAFCLTLFAFAIFSESLQATQKPNIVYIMVDDLGYGDLGSYGQKVIQTPHLDRMAAEGIRFENAYATALCTPTRVMIMSGLYPNRTGYRALIGKGEGVRLVPDTPLRSPFVTLPSR